LSRAEAAGEPSDAARIRCRIAACRAASAGGDWVFHLFNDGAQALDAATLLRAEAEWGDRSFVETPDVRVGPLAPGAHASIWRSDGELRTTLVLAVHAGAREVRLSFEFPKLYLQRCLHAVAGLPGLAWEESAEA